MEFQTHYDEFPIVIFGPDGVVDRVRDATEAWEYVQSMPDEGLDYYDSGKDAAQRVEP